MATSPSSTTLSRAKHYMALRLAQSRIFSHCSAYVEAHAYRQVNASLRRDWPPAPCSISPASSIAGIMMEDR